MQIILHEEEAEYLEEKLKDDDWWIANSIKGRIKVERELRSEKLNCKHSEGKYVGERICCTKCGGFFKDGHSESWDLKKG